MTKSGCCFPGVGVDILIVLRLGSFMRYFYVLSLYMQDYCPIRDYALISILLAPRREHRLSMSGEDVRSGN